MYDLDSKGKYSWASDIRMCLYMYGFGYVWENQGVECIEQFMFCFKQRLIDCFWQDWDAHIQNSDRFSVYKSIKSRIGLEPYFKIKVNRHIMRALIKFVVVFQVSQYIRKDIDAQMINS